MLVGVCTKLVTGDTVVTGFSSGGATVVPLVSLILDTRGLVGSSNDFPSS